MVTSLTKTGTQRLAEFAQAADEIANSAILTDYQETKSYETLRRQQADIAVFQNYLSEPGVIISGMADDLSLWANVSSGTVSLFKRWMYTKGYALSTINMRLSTVKVYCGLAKDAGYIPAPVYSRISGIKSYSQGQLKHVNSKRTTIRQSTKKASATPLTLQQAQLLKYQPGKDTALAIRDRFLMCLLLDHGLRVSEICDLQVSGLDVQSGTLTFYRRKVNITQVHRLSNDTLQAAKSYIAAFTLPDNAPLFQGYTEGQAITTRGINSRVVNLGKEIGVHALSPHDCRHYWATVAMAHGTSVKALQDAGGWRSPIMPLQYAASSNIANEGVKLS